jgi:hypothetical protein
VKADVRLSILAEPCDACPFKGRFDGLEAGRLRDIVERCTANDSYFVCHKTVDYGQYEPDEGEEPDTAVGADAVFGPAKVCAGWLEAAPWEPTVIQVARRLGFVEEVRL